MHKMRFKMRSKMRCCQVPSRSSGGRTTQRHSSAALCSTSGTKRTALFAVLSLRGAHVPLPPPLSPSLTRHSLLVSRLWSLVSHICFELSLPSLSAVNFINLSPLNVLPLLRSQHLRVSVTTLRGASTGFVSPSTKCATTSCTARPFGSTHGVWGL